MDYNLAVGMCRHFAWCDEPLLIPDRVDLRPPTVVTSLPFGTVTVTPAFMKNSGRWEADVNVHCQQRYWEESTWLDVHAYGLTHMQQTTMCRSRRYPIIPGRIEFGLVVGYRHQNSRYKTSWNGVTRAFEMREAFKWQKGWWLIIEAFEWRKNDHQVPHATKEQWHWHRVELTSLTRKSNSLFFDEAVKCLRNDEGTCWGAWLDKAMNEGGPEFECVARYMDQHLVLPVWA